VATRPGVTSTILGASKFAQLEDNLSAIEFSIPTNLRQQLDAVSAPPSIHPYMFFEPFIQGMIHGGTKVRGWTEQQHRLSNHPSEQEDVVGAEKIA